MRNAGKKKRTKVTRSLLSFLEKCHYLVYTSWKFNHVTTFLFFFLLLLNSIASIIFKPEAHSDSHAICDVLCFIIGLTPHKASKYGIDLAIFVSILILLGLIIVFLVEYLLKESDKAFVQPILHIFLYIFIPLFFPASINIAQRVYAQVDKFGLYTQVYLAVFSHVLYICMFCTIFVAHCMSVTIVNHPVGIRSFRRCFEVVLFIIIINHGTKVSVPTQDYWLILRMISAIIMLFLVIFDPPYYIRYINVLLLVVIVFDLFTIPWLLIGSDIIFSIWYYFIIPSILIPVIIFYVIYPIIVLKRNRARNIFTDFLCGFYEESKFDIENCDLILMDEFQLRMAICIGFELNAFHLKEIVDQYQNFQYTSIVSTVIYELATSKIAANEKGISEETEEMLKNNQRKILEYKNVFWSKVWISDIEALPKISAIIGRSIAKLQLNHSVISLQYPKYETKEDDFPNLDNSCFKTNLGFFHKLCYRFGLVEWLTLSIFFIFIISYSFILQDVLREWYYVTSFFTLRQVTSDLLHFIQDYAMTGSLTMGMVESLNNSFYESKQFFRSKKAYSEYVSSKNSSDKLIDYISEFIDACVEALNNHTFPLEQFNSFVDTYDDKISCFSTNILPYYVKERPIHLIVFTAIECLIPTILVIIIIIKFIKLYHQIGSFYPQFRLIPKESLANYAHIDTNQSIEELLAIPHSPIRVLFIYLATTISCLLALICCSIYIILYQEVKSYSRSEIKNLIEFNHEMIFMDRISVRLIDGAISTYISGQSPETIKAFTTLDTMIFEFKRSNYTATYSKIPLGVYDVIGQSLILNQSIDVNYTLNMINEMDDSVILERNTVSYRNKYYISRFVTEGIMILIIYIIYLYEMWFYSVLVKSEQTMGKIIFDEILETNIIDPDKMTRFMERKENILDSCQLFIFATDADLNVKYLSHAAKEKLGIIKGQNLKESRLEISTVNDIMLTINNIHSNNPKSVYTIPYSNENTLVVCPTMKYIDEMIVVDHVFFIDLKDSPAASADIEKKSNLAFYSIYPPFVSRDQEFPYEIKTNGRPFLFIFVKLLKFNEWCDTIDVSISNKFRREISQYFNELLGESTNFCKLRETNSTLIAMMNREENKLSVWTMVEAAGFLGKRMLDFINTTKIRYNADISSCVLLFKCKEPNYYMTNQKMAMIDFSTDLISQGEEYIYNCKENIINYASQRKENRVPNTSKLKTCYTANGDQYEILIVV